MKKYERRSGDIFDMLKVYKILVGYYKGKQLSKLKGK
jgi:hypothetical protein